MNSTALHRATTDATHDQHSSEQAARLDMDEAQSGLLTDVYSTRDHLVALCQERGFSIHDSALGNDELKLHDQRGSRIEIVNALRIMHDSGQVADGGCTFRVDLAGAPEISEDGRAFFKLHVTPAILLPAPTPEMVDGVVDIAEKDEATNQSFKSLVELFRRDVYQERFDHESEHLDDMLSGTPWGKVLFTGQLIGERQTFLRSRYNVDAHDPRIEVRTLLAPELHKHLTPETPTLEQLLAARLISELRAFCHNSTGVPEIAAKAKDVSSAVSRSILGGASGIEQNILEWQGMISKEPGYENLGDPKLAGIAAAWITEHGNFD